MADPHVEKHWPQLVALIDTLDTLHGRTVNVAVKSAPSDGAALTERDIDKIHEGLLQKQRGGSLGLNA